MPAAVITWFPSRKHPLLPSKYGPQLTNLHRSLRKRSLSPAQDRIVLGGCLNPLGPSSCPSQPASCGAAYPPSECHPIGSAASRLCHALSPPCNLRASPFSILPVEPPPPCHPD